MEKRDIDEEISYCEVKIIWCKLIRSIRSIDSDIKYTLMSLKDDLFNLVDDALNIYYDEYSYKPRKFSTHMKNIVYEDNFVFSFDYQTYLNYPFHIYITTEFEDKKYWVVIKVKTPQQKLEFKQKISKEYQTDFFFGVEKIIKRYKKNFSN